MIYTWFIHDLCMIYAWFTHNLYIIYTWFIHNLYMIYTSFIHDLYMIYQYICQKHVFPNRSRFPFIFKKVAVCFTCGPMGRGGIPCKCLHESCTFSTIHLQKENHVYLLPWAQYRKIWTKIQSLKKNTKWYFSKILKNTVKQVKNNLWNL